jgi:arginyl-tRNA synthetase
MFRNTILEAIAKTSKANKDQINLEFPENADFGDYSTNIALLLKISASELAEKLKKDEKLSEVVDRIEVAGPGFINFWLKKDVLVDNLMEIDSKGQKYGRSEIGKGKTVVIDYSAPNIAKPFGIGHLRSTIIGQALYNLYTFLGYRVIGDNHLGDWGTQFGKLLYMIDAKKLENFDLSTLEEMYVEFHELAEKDPKLDEAARIWFKKLEEGDSKARDIWQKCVDVSMQEFERIYKLLGVKIDFVFGESYYEAEMKTMTGDANIQKYLSDGEDGAKIIDLASVGINTPLMFLKKDGGTTYATRDLATIIFRSRKWDPDIIIYEVGAEQSLHFRQLFAASRLLGIIKDKVELIHTAHGLYLAPDGKKFSTRKGKTIKLEEVLSEAIEKAKKLGNKEDKVAKEVGIGAIKYFDLMHHPSSDIVFDWEKILNLEGNSGPYLQYTIARTNSLLEKAGGKKGKTESQSTLTTGEAIILRSLIRFPEIIDYAAKSYSPNILCTYLYDLAQKFNTFYNAQRVIGSKSESLDLAITFGVGQVLKNGLTILGIGIPQKM